MLIKEIATKANTTPRTIQRDIDSYNLLNGTDHSNSLKEPIEDEGLIGYLAEKRGVGLVQAKTTDVHRSIVSDDLVKKPTVVREEPTKQRQQANLKPKRKKKVDLQTRLSADWLIMLVILSILASDMVSFYVLSDAAYGGRLPFVPFFFAPLGLICGIGAVVTYNRIENTWLAELWKYGFAVLQFVLFEFALAEMSGDHFQFISGQTVMSFTQVAVFTGALRSIKR